MGVALGCLISAHAAQAQRIPAKAKTKAKAAPAASAANGETMSVNGERLGGLEHFDPAIIAYMRQHKIPGGSLALVRNGKLLYARGFGYADLERREPVRPTSLFRIASISKTITAVAILHLVEQRKLDENARVFDLLALDRKLAPGAQLDARWKEITVSHLLRHEGGWDLSRSRDPFVNGLEVLKFNRAAPPLSSDHMIRYMLARPLNFDPGKEHAYNNFGYCLLGRVIEAVAGKPYEDFVREEILLPMGIRDMRVGKTLEKDRVPGEVCYYQLNEPRMLPSVFGPKLGEPVAAPYGSESIESADSSGGWIASSVDLVRFATALDPDSSYKALSPQARASMLRRPTGPSGYEPGGRPRDIYYAYGLQVRALGVGPETRVNAWHGGGIWGSSSFLLKGAGGLNVAMLFNRLEDPELAGFKNLALGFEPTLTKMLDRVSTWPRGNLFPRFTSTAVPGHPQNRPAPAPSP
jgi:N-acyl-D-amino-acid deacylase